MLHHTLGDGRCALLTEFLTSHSHPFRFDAYLRAAKQVTYSNGAVFDVNSAASEIDRVLTDCITSVSLHSLLNLFAQ